MRNFKRISVGDLARDTRQDSLVNRLRKEARTFDVAAVDANEGCEWHFASSVTQAEARGAGPVRPIP